MESLLRHSVVSQLYLRCIQTSPIYDQGVLGLLDMINIAYLGGIWW